MDVFENSELNFSWNNDWDVKKSQDGSCNQITKLPLLLYISHTWHILKWVRLWLHSCHLDFFDTSCRKSHNPGVIILIYYLPESEWLGWSKLIPIYFLCRIKLLLLTLHPWSTLHYNSYYPLSVYTQGNCCAVRNHHTLD